MSCLKGEANRRKAPSLKEFLAPVIMEMDPDEGIEDQYKVSSVGNTSTQRSFPRASMHVCVVCQTDLPHGPCLHREPLLVMMEMRAIVPGGMNVAQQCPFWDDHHEVESQRNIFVSPDWQLWCAWCRPKRMQCTHGRR